MAPQVARDFFGGSPCASCVMKRCLVLVAIVLPAALAMAAVRANLRCRSSTRRAGPRLTISPHARAARHSRATAGAERPCREAERRELRRSESEPVSAAARSADAAQRREGHVGRRCGGASVGRRSSRISSARSYGRVPRAYRTSHGRWSATREGKIGGTPSRRQEARRPRRQLRLSRDQGRDLHDAHDAGRCEAVRCRS